MVGKLNFKCPLWVQFFLTKFQGIVEQLYIKMNYIVWSNILNLFLNYQLRVRNTNYRFSCKEKKQMKQNAKIWVVVVKSELYSNTLTPSHNYTYTNTCTMTLICIRYFTEIAHIQNFHPNIINAFCVIPTSVSISYTPPWPDKVKWQTDRHKHQHTDKV